MEGGKGEKMGGNCNTVNNQEKILKMVYSVVVGYNILDQED